MARKRAPGGGRKPSGPISGKLSTFSTRITHETRVGLEAEAGATGQSISQVAEQMIALGLAVKREREQTSPSRALTFLIGELADACGAVFGEREFHWNSDSFAFDALTHAIRLLLERLRPAESALTKYLHDGKDVDDLDREMFASPESWAKHNFYRLWDELEGKQHTLPVEIPSDEVLGWVKRYAKDTELNRLLWKRGDMRKIFQYASNLEKVRRDLNLKVRPIRGGKS